MVASNIGTLQLNIDRVHAAQLGLTEKEVVDNVITSLNSNTMIAPNYWVDHKTGNDYFLTVQYYENGKSSIHDPIDRQQIPLRVSRPFKLPRKWITTRSNAWRMCT